MILKHQYIFSITVQVYFLECIYEINRQSAMDCAGSFYQPGWLWGESPDNSRKLVCLGWSLGVSLTKPGKTLLFAKECHNVDILKQRRTTRPSRQQGSLGGIFMEALRATWHDTSLNLVKGSRGLFRYMAQFSTAGPKLGNTVSI